jgi:hypothetical protein
MRPDLPRGTSPNSESSHTSQNPDYATWLTKQQAADRIGVSTKTIEAFAKDGKIQQAVYRPQNRGAAKAVYHPDDVARIARERQPGAKAFVLPAGVTSPVNGNGHGRQLPAVSIDTASPTGEDVLRLVFAAALQRLTAEPPATSENSEKSTAAYVDKTEALAIAGVSYGELREAVRKGEVKQRGRRYRRQDLEAL